MGRTRTVIRYTTPQRPWLRSLPRGLERRRPRDYEEWRTLRRWGMLPEWEPESPGYLLRDTRERSGLTQAALAERLGVTQQAVAAAERWDANPTVAFLRRWARACDQDVALVFSPGKEKASR